MAPKGSLRVALNLRTYIYIDLDAAWWCCPFSCLRALAPDCLVAVSRHDCHIVFRAFYCFILIIFSYSYIQKSKYVRRWIFGSYFIKILKKYTLPFPAFSALSRHLSSFTSLGAAASRPISEHRRWISSKVPCGEVWHS